jgi:pyridoxine 5-phosphate synthase
MKLVEPVFLGINIDHIATVRQLRGTPYPNLVEAMHLVEAGGADGITLHLREDRRHIQDHDVTDVMKSLSTQLNFECSIVPDMLDIAIRTHPHSVCLVPERRQELTTEGGLDVRGQFDQTKSAVRSLQQSGIRVSLFINSDLEQIKAAADSGAEMIEIHTGRYADSPSSDISRELENICAAAELANQLGLQVNAGHGLCLENVVPIVQIPQIVELNIGHAIVARALFVGLKESVREMKSIITKTRSAMLEKL